MLGITVNYFVANNSAQTPVIQITLFIRKDKFDISKYTNLNNIETHFFNLLWYQRIKYGRD